LCGFCGCLDGVAWGAEELQVAHAVIVCVCDVVDFTVALSSMAEAAALLTS
jgi:hypothetical protein